MTVWQRGNEELQQAARQTSELAEDLLTEARKEIDEKSRLLEAAAEEAKEAKKETAELREKIEANENVIREIKKDVEKSHAFMKSIQDKLVTSETRKEQAEKRYREIA